MIQATPFCNIDCSYCYLPYRSKKGQFPLELLDPLFAKLLDCGLLGEAVSVVWHAGEPLVLPPTYYHMAFERINTVVANECHVTHFFQSNGTLITQDYCDLFKSPQVRVGLSIDGPDFIHDRHRTTRSKKGTHREVLDAVGLLKKNRISFSVIAVLTSYSLAHADEIYDFFKEIGPHEIGFNIDEVEGSNTRSSLTGSEIEHQYRCFMRRILERVRHDRGTVRVRELMQGYGLFSASLFGHEAVSSESNPLSIISCDMGGNLFTFSPELVDVSDGNGGGL
jgi:uncharacterized protein